MKDAGKSAIDLYLISEEDSHYEQEILRDPYSSLKPWLRYIENKLKTGTVHEQVFVFERACKALPRSYKLWKMVVFTFLYSSIQ
jgi:pre-mRNA-splicing factor SYF1